MEHLRLEYTIHAQQRMKQRGITKEEVEHYVVNYDIRYHDPKGNMVYRSSLSYGKRIKVVTKGNTNDPAVVITVADI